MTSTSPSLTNYAKALYRKIKTMKDIQITVTKNFVTPKLKLRGAIKKHYCLKKEVGKKYVYLVRNLRLHHKVNRKILAAIILTKLI